MTLKALTVRQPWASLIALGQKTVETRGQRTHHRGTLAVHAGKEWKLNDFIDLCHSDAGPAIAKALTDAGRIEPHTERRTKGPYPGGVFYSSTELVHDLPLGAIVAVVDVVDCVRVGDETAWPRALDHVGGWERWLEQRHFGDYRSGRWAWLLADLRPLPDPVPCRGAQGLWNVPADVEATVRAQLEQVPAS